MQTTFNTNANTALYLRDERETYHRATEDEVLNAALNAINARLAPGTPIETPDQAHDFIKLRLAPYPHEVFGVLWLDSRHNVIAFDELFRGSLCGAAVFPREVVKSALNHNAAACILCHNHPSGACGPSEADKTVTRKINDALSLIEVRTLDHLIVGEQIYSFSEHGLI